MEELPINEIIRSLPDEEELDDTDYTLDDFDEGDLKTLINDFIVRPDDWCNVHPSLSSC